DCDPGCEREAWVDLRLAEPRPCCPSALLWLEPAQAVRLDRPPSGMVQPLHAGNRLLDPEVLRVGGEPVERRTAVWIQQIGLVAAPMRTPVALMVLFMPLAVAVVQPLAGAGPCQVLASQHAAVMGRAGG